MENYGTPVSDREIQVEIGILELTSAVAMAAGSALKIVFGTIATTGLAVSGTTRIIATAAGERPENVEQGATAVTTVTWNGCDLGHGRHLKAGRSYGPLNTSWTGESEADWPTIRSP